MCHICQKHHTSHLNYFPLWASLPYCNSSLGVGTTPSFQIEFPDSKNSFFHIGVRIFMLSIAYLHASKASWRWTVVTAIATLISFTLRLPILCMAMNFLTFQFL